MTENSNLIIKDIKKSLNRACHVKFPEIRGLFHNIKIISSFSHSNINLPIDEIYGNLLLIKLREKANLKNSNFLNILYDNSIPEKDSPKGFKIEYGSTSPVVLSPGIPYSYQKMITYDEKTLFKNNNNILHSIPDENQRTFQKRIDRINKTIKEALQKNGLNTVEKITAIRKEFFSLLKIDPIKENPFSKLPTALCARTLELLYQKGYPFWDITLPENYSKYKKQTYLIEGIDCNNLRTPVRFEKDYFIFKYSDTETKRINKNNIFSSLLKRETIPTMPLVIMCLMVAPQIIHIGGAFWPKYAKPIAYKLIKWLGVKSDVDDLLKSTKGLKPISIYKKSRFFYGFPLIYSVFGRKKILEHLDSLKPEEVELQRRVFKD